MVLIALGANLPNCHLTKIAILQQATLRLRQFDVEILTHSSWYVSRAWPDDTGPSYVNAVISLRKAPPPFPLLQAMQRIEREFGRKMISDPWAPRRCDLDLLAYGQMMLPSSKVSWQHLQSKEVWAEKEARPQLIVPHPMLGKRAFVLKPLVEIAANWRHPVHKISAGRLLARLPVRERGAVRRLHLPNFVG